MKLQRFSVCFDPRRSNLEIGLFLNEQRAWDALNLEPAEIAQAKRDGYRVVPCLVFPCGADVNTATPAARR